MQIDINTAPTDEALEHCHFCLANATEAGDALACAHFRALIWALEKIGRAHV